jgi:ATP-binding cassette subfamily F protein uup
MAPRNLLNLENVSASYGKGPVLDEVSLGIAKGERIGVVGRNGGGKSTLLRVMSGLEAPQSGRVTHVGDLRIGVLAQSAVLDPAMTVRRFVLGEDADHVWATRADAREVLTELLGGFDATLLDRPLGPLSGGERRRVELARLLLDELDLLVLDEPTNHLDVEAVAWLSRHLLARRGLALVVVTHDRWFLDEVSDQTWEVVRGKVEAYEGGYSAFVLAKAERLRQAGEEERKRKNLMTKELAWLRRGAPARTAKPKFRIEAANVLIESEPPPRDAVELLAFAGARLGRTVLELHDASLTYGDRVILDRVTWNLGPGDRVGIVGVNGAGKTSLVRALLGEQSLSSGRLVTGQTVKPAYLSQHLEELDPSWRVLEAVEKVARSVDLGKGRELTASQLCERLGFGSDAQWTPVGDLSGGERRRLQLTRLLMDGPNVLVLDEPTNDFDVETLAALEDLLDSFAGTLLVISHDRYFLERVCDQLVGLLGDGQVRSLPRGIEEYLTLLSDLRSSTGPDSPQGTRAVTPPAHSGSESVPAVTAQPALSAAEVREQRKEMAKQERRIATLEKREAELHAALAEAATDYEKAVALSAELDEVRGQKESAEEAWLQAAEGL